MMPRGSGENQAISPLSIAIGNIPVQYASRRSEAGMILDRRRSCTKEVTSCQCQLLVGEEGNNSRIVLRDFKCLDKSSNGWISRFSFLPVSINLSVEMQTITDASSPADN